MSPGQNHPKRHGTFSSLRDSLPNSLRACLRQSPGERPRRLPQQLTLLAAAGLLASCAALQQGQTPPAEQQPTGAPTPVSPPPVTAGPVADQTPAQAAAPADNGINRDGQVIQLGRFAEPQPPLQPPANNVVELNYEQEELRLVFEQLGDAINLNMIIDPTIDARVSLRTSANNPLRYEDIWPLMRLLARNAGVTITQAGNVYQFTRSATSLPVEIVMPEWLNDAGSSVVLQVTPLTYISVDAALPVLTPLIGENAITRLGPANLIGISGTPEELARVNAMLDVIDADPFQTQGIRLYELRNSAAAEVAEELRNVMTLIEGEQSAYQILGLERINAVLVLAPATRGFQEVDRWINVLDSDSQNQREQLFFYRVRNLSAPTLAETLTSVFAREEGTTVLPADEEDLNAPIVAPGSERAEELNLPGAPSGQRNANNGDSGNDGAMIVSADLSVVIVADEDTNSLLIRATPREFQQLMVTINNLDMSPPQVLINAVIGQVTLTDSNSFGVDWVRVSSNAASGPARLGTRFLPGNLFNEAGQQAPGSGLIFTKTFTDGSAIIDATLQAIAQDNDVSLLARPSVLVADNQEGEIKVGQSVPINTGTTVTQNANVANIAYRDVGIVLTITPHINDDGFVNLEIFQSLSSVEPNVDGVAGNPVFTNQEITTRALVTDQSAIILGGMIQDDRSFINAGIPGLKDIPLFGGLFGYQSRENVRRELFVILRPQIIRENPAGSPAMQQLRDSFRQLDTLFKEAGL